MFSFRFRDAIIMLLCLMSCKITVFNWNYDHEVHDTCRPEHHLGSGLHAHLSRKGMDGDSSFNQFMSYRLSTASVI